MPTFGEMKPSIAKRLIDPSSTAVSLTDVGDAINDAIKFWKYQRFWFNEGDVDLIMDINDPFILQYGNSKPAYPSAPVLPSDFLVETPENGFVINWNNLSYTMIKKQPREYDSVNVRGIGLPYIYCFRAGNYEFYFHPNIAYTMTVRYLRDYIPMTLDNETNDFTDYADKLIIYDALYRLSSELRQDEKMALYYSNARSLELTNLVQRTSKQTETGKLSVETIL